jgi:hypothetical protein
MKSYPPFAKARDKILSDVRSVSFSGEVKVGHARERGHPGWCEGMNQAKMDSR